MKLTGKVGALLRHADRFWSFVERRSKDECWPWLSGTSEGYGLFTFDGESERAHRVAFAIAGGSFSDGPHVLHSCDNRPCCNPAHLRSGTQADNVRDMVSRNRASRGGAHSAVLRRTAARGDANGSRTRPERVARGARVASAKLSEAQVVEVRRLIDQTTATELAQRFSVSRATIGRALKGETWAAIPGARPGARKTGAVAARNGRAKLTPEQVAEIRRLGASGAYSLAELGRRFGVHYGTIRRAIDGTYWGSVRS